MRRRALLAASQLKGGLTFPIYLVEGDNGEIGKSLYEWFFKVATPNEGGNPEHSFEPVEEVYVLEYRVTAMYAYNSDYIIVNVYIPGALTCFLHPDGTVVIGWD